jgi:hypothetical protein
MGGRSHLPGANQLPGGLQPFTIPRMMLDIGRAQTAPTLHTYDWGHVTPAALTLAWLRGNQLVTLPRPIGLTRAAATNSFVQRP